MNARQLTLILISALVLGAIGWVLFYRGARSWEGQPTAGDEKVVEFPLNDVAHLTIKDGTGELNLDRKEDGWVVRERADYPANFEQVSRLLQKIWNLKPVQTLQVGPSQLARFDLVEPTKDSKSGASLELKNKDGKRIAGLLVGKQYLRKSKQSFGPAEFPVGRYVMAEDDSKRVALVSDPLSDLVTEPERWLNREFIKIEKPKTIALDGTRPEMKWKLVRKNETADWKFADAKPGEELDKSKATALPNTISNLNFTDVLDPKTALETIGLDQPNIATIETFDGFSYALKIGKLKGETCPVMVSVAEHQPPAPSSSAPNEKAEKPAKPGEKLAKEKKFEGRPFLINKFSIDQLLKNRADLLKVEPSSTPALPGPVGQPTPMPPATPKTKP